MKLEYDINSKEIKLGDRVKILGENPAIGKIIMQGGELVVNVENEDWYYFHELETNGVLQIEVIK